MCGCTKKCLCPSIKCTKQQAIVVWIQTVIISRASQHDNLCNFMRNCWTQKEMEIKQNKNKHLLTKSLHSKCNVSKWKSHHARLVTYNVERKEEMANNLCIVVLLDKWNCADCVGISMCDAGGCVVANSMPIPKCLNWKCKKPVFLNGHSMNQQQLHSNKGSKRNNSKFCIKQNKSGPFQFFCFCFWRRFCYIANEHESVAIADTTFNGNCVVLFDGIGFILQ